MNLIRLASPSWLKIRILINQHFHDSVSRSETTWFSKQTKKNRYLTEKCVFLTTAQPRYHHHLHPQWKVEAADEFFMRRKPFNFLTASVCTYTQTYYPSLRCVPVRHSTTNSDTILKWIKSKKDFSPFLLRSNLRHVPVSGLKSAGGGGNACLEENIKTDERGLGGINPWHQSCRFCRKSGISPCIG